MNTATTVEATATVAVEQSLFIAVPETTLPCGTTVPSFQVGQFFCGKDDAGKAAVSASATPWVEINYHDARKACSDAGFALLTELQALAIAHDIANQGANWTSGTVGEGKLKQGLRNGTVDEAQPGSFVPDDADEDRWFVLSNGSRICDAAGNIYSWIFDNVQGDERGLTAKAFAKESPSIATAPHPSMERGMGWRPRAGTDWSGGALVRGGCWDGGDDAGVFLLGYGWPGNGYVLVGFRCTKPA